MNHRMRYIKYKNKEQLGGAGLDDLPPNFNTFFPQGMMADQENINIIQDILFFLRGKSNQNITILSISSGSARTEALLLKYIKEDPILQNKKINLILYDILYDSPSQYNKIFKLYSYIFRPDNLTLYYNIAGLSEDVNIKNIDILIGFNIQQAYWPSKNFTPETVGFKALCKLLLQDNKVDITTPVFIYNKEFPQFPAQRSNQFNLQDFCTKYF